MDGGLVALRFIVPIEYARQAPGNFTVPEKQANEEQQHGHNYRQLVDMGHRRFDRIRLPFCTAGPWLTMI